MNTTVKAMINTKINLSRFRTLFLVLFFLLFVALTKGSAQIYGQGIVCRNTTVTYYCQSQGPYSWWVSGGSISGSSSNVGVSINWGSGSSGTVWVTSSAGTSSLSITISPSVSAGSIGGTKTICYNSSAGMLNNVSSGSGGTYGWQQSTTGTGSWTNISGATSSTYVPGNLTATKYYRRTVTSSGCGTVYSGNVKVTVYANLTAGSINGAKSICYGASGGTLGNTSLATGGTGSYAYQWEQSISGTGSWSNASGSSTGTTLTLGNLTTSMYYRRKVTSGSCLPQATDKVKITVYGNLAAGSINGAKTICYNASAGTLGNASSPTGGTGSYAYQWQVSTSGTGSWSNISGATSTTYAPGNLTASKYYQRRVISGSCGTVYTGNVKVTVYGNLAAGSINGAKTICYNTSAGTLGNASSATGGTGSYAYQWQQSTTGTGSWSNISGATGTTYAPGNLTATKYYRRRVISGSCGTKYTGNVKVTVYGNFAAGSINGAKTICYNASAGTLGNASSASGGTGSYAYQWQHSTSGTGSWSNISGATATTYAPGNLTASKYYRRRVISGSCGTKYTGNVKVTVYGNFAAGSINGAKTICYNASAGTLGNASSATGGTGSYTYQWQISTSGTGSWSNVSGATGTTYAPGNLTTTKYYRRRVISGSCGTVYTGNVKVTVYGNLAAGSINGAKTICYNASAGTLGNASSATGGTGSYTYQWQISTTGTGSWSNVSGATGTTYAPGNLTATKYYRRRVISGSCGTVYTGNVKVTVYGNLAAGSINGAKTICYNASAGTLGNASSPTGGTGSYAYQWQSSTTGTGSWTNVSGATGTTYAPGNLTATKYYRRRVISGSCGTVYTGNVKVTVYGNLAAGSINGANTICYSTSAGTLGNASFATGGTGSYTYQWQISTTGTGSWSNVSGATATTYAPGNLTATKYYRRASTSGSCGTVYTGNVKITVYGNLGSGSINGAKTICYNASAGTLGNTSFATGGTGSYAYQWQSSTTGTGSWSNVSGATATTYAPGNLTATKYYRRAATSGACGTVYTGNVAITVYGNLASGSINGTKTICYNTSAGTLGNASSPTGGTGSYTYQWQASSDNTTWSNISGETATTYVSGNLTATTYYRRGVTSGSCSTLYTSSILVTVYDNLTAGSINGADTICYNTSAGTLGSLSLPTGGTGSYTYQWQASSDNTTWSNISGETATNYVSGNLTATTYYRRGVTSGSCSTLYTSSILVTVYDNLTAGSINGADTICYNTSAGTLGSVSLPTGSTGSYTYQWQNSSDNITWSNISAATATTYAPGNLTTPTYYRRAVTSGSCGTVYTSSVFIGINALPIVQVPFDFDIYITAATKQLYGTPYGGVWTGIGIDTTAFDPAVAGLGTHVLTYAYTDSLGCVGIDSLMSKVTPDQGNVLDSIELAVLKDIYVNLGGPNWNIKTNWPDTAVWPMETYSTDFATWQGITVVNGDITEINLSNNNLTGVLPPSMALLTPLQLFNLNGNAITDTIPDEFGDLSNLQDLQLADNQLTGSIPETLGQLYNLKHLYLGTNNFQGGVPSSFSSLINLENLSIPSAGLSGIIPDHLGYLSNLGYIDLSQNNLTESIPTSFGNLSNLSLLYLNNNSLSGDIPSNIWSISTLSDLQLGINQLTGSLPMVIDSLSSLQHLSVANNNLTGNFPVFSALPNLETLHLNNNELTGAMISDFTDSPLLKEFYLHNNALTAMTNISTHINNINMLVNVENNNIPFADIELNVITDSTNNFNTFIYMSQYPVPDKVTKSAMFEGDSISLNTYDVSISNTYLWEKLNTDGITWQDVTSLNDNPTGDKFTINGLTAENAGVYHYTITNPVTGQSKTSDDIEMRVMSPETFDQLVFKYKYDHRNRMIEKEVPGAGVVYMVYDDRDRLVLTQDANQRCPELVEGHQWTFTKYDALNRPVLTGIYTNSTDTTRETMQTKVNAEVGTLGTTWYETTIMATDGNVHGYDNASFPYVPDSTDYLTVTYYDDYDFRDELADFLETDYTYDNTQLNCQTPNATYCFPTTELGRVRGQVTGGKVKNLDDNTWLKSVIYYDNKYRIIQSITDNQIEGIDKVSMLYDFVGQVLETKTAHSDGVVANETKRNFDYDHAGRLLTVKHQLNDDPDEIILVQNDYNELGELVDKQLHSTDNGTIFEQSVDYRYNIRGWLTSINDASLDGSGTYQHNIDDLLKTSKDYFGMNLGYNTDLDGLNPTLAYNGNISAMKWSGDSDTEQLGYGYTYDAMNRLWSADYQIVGAGVTDNFDVIIGDALGSGYDLNGNIKSLTRNGKDGTPMDNLAYTYHGNQVQKIEDGGDMIEGFKDGNQTGSGYEDFAYDANGNMTQDLNNGLTKITYNYLNLPDTVWKDEGGYIRYLYDAIGIKLGQETYDVNGVQQSRLDYVGAFVYAQSGAADPSELTSIQHEEGSIVPSAGSATDPWVYQYDLKDHLGNTRLTFTTQPNTINFPATFETENATEEEYYYYNIAETRETFPTADANSDGGDEVVSLNGNRPMGAGLGVTIGVGDTLSMEVYGYYEGGSGYSTESALNVMIGAIAGGFGGATGAGVTEAQQTTYDLFDNAITGIGVTGTSDDLVPAAFINYMLFDEDMNVYQNGYKQITSAANGSHEQITIDDVVITKAGVAYIWLSNESASLNWVHFDDMNVMIKESKVIKREDIMPFGLTFNGYERYNPDFDGTYKENGLGWKDLGFRQYDPASGRFNVIDPLTELQLRESQYQYAGNNPVNYIDVLGLLTDAEKAAKKKAKQGKKDARAKKRQSKTKRGINLKGRNDNTSLRSKLKKNKKKKDKKGGSKDSKDSGGSGSFDWDPDGVVLEGAAFLDDSFGSPTPKKDNGNTTSVVKPNHSPRITPTSSGTTDQGTTWMKGDDNPTEISKQYQKAKKLERIKWQDLVERNVPILQALAISDLVKYEKHTAGPQLRKIALKAIEKNEKAFEDKPNDPDAVQEVLDIIKQANENGDSTINLSALKKKYGGGLHQKKGMNLNGTKVDVTVIFGFDEGEVDPRQRDPTPSRLGTKVNYDFDKKGEKDKFLVRIAVDIDDKEGRDELEKYLGINPARRILEDNNPLTVSQIVEVREKLDKMTDEEEKKELYLLLHKKIKYESQRKIDIQAKDGTLERTARGETRIGDWMCAISSIGRVLEFFGEDNASGQELEQYRQDNYAVPNPLPEGVSSYWTHSNYRTKWKLWDKILTDKGYQRSSVAGYGLDNALTEQKIKDDFKAILEAGEGIIIGISRSHEGAVIVDPESPNYQGHIVVVVGYDDNGLIIDDPNGETDIVNFYDGGTRWTNKNSDFNGGDDIHGDGITWLWSDIIQIRFKSVHKIEKTQ